MVLFLLIFDKVKRFIFLSFLILFFLNPLGWSRDGLPKSINVISGQPLTFPKHSIESIGLKPHENTGGWGDVMANITMAQDLKRQFPNVDVRLIITLNDQDERAHVNKLRPFIPNILRNEKNEIYLDPDSKEKQTYKNIDVYFVAIDSTIGLMNPDTMTAEQRTSLEQKTIHIPMADLGLQYSANDSPYNMLVSKSQKMQLYFEEYSKSKQSHAYIFFKEGIPQLKINSGPLSFGVYGLDQENPKEKSIANNSLIDSWLRQLGDDYPKLSKLNLNASNRAIAFAYAGDKEMIADYVQAVRELGESDDKRKTVIVYKGSGPIRIIRDHVLIPIGAHPKELADALIAESTYSPLVTGDGSLSSALATTNKKKSFLYEKIEWKLESMKALLDRVFEFNPELKQISYDLQIPRTENLRKLKLSRAYRIEKIKKMLSALSIHERIDFFISRNRNALNIADNTMNMFQLLPIFQTLKVGSENGKRPLDLYSIWLTQLSKTFMAEQGPPFERLSLKLSNKTQRDPSQLLQKWFILFTLWELDRPTNTDDVIRVVAETKDFILSKATMKKFRWEDSIYSMLSEIDKSVKSKYAIYSAIKNDSKAWGNFNLTKQNYKDYFSKNLKLVRQNSCLRVYSPFY